MRFTTTTARSIEDELRDRADPNCPTCDGTGCYAELGDDGRSHGRPCGCTERAELDVIADEHRDAWIAHQEAARASEGVGAEQPSSCDALDPFAGLPLDATPLSPEELDRAVASRANDAILVRLDLASSARDLGLRCVEHVLRSEAPNGADALRIWSDIAADFERYLGDNRRLARSCAKAALAMRTGDVEAAICVLAEHCGMSPHAWAEATELECTDCGGEGTGGASGRLLCPTCRGDGVVGAGR